MKIIIPILSAMVLLAGCASSNNTQVYAAMTGLQAGATLGGAIGGLTSRNPRGYHMGTTIGALSGAAIGAIATAPRYKRGERDRGYDEAYDGDVTTEAPRRKGKPTFAPLSGLRRDVRVTNVTFRDSSGDGILQPGETATVSYDIINVTPWEIELLIPKIELSRQAKRIHLSPMQDITNILSSEGVRYSVTLTAGPRLKGGETELTLYLSSDGGATFTAMNTIQITTNK